MDFKFYQNLLLEDEEYVFDIHTAASIGCDELLVSILKASPGQLDAGNASGWTPLMLSAGLAQLRALGQLLRLGANVQPRDPKGQSALILAAKSGSAQAVSMLIDAGASSEDRDGRGCTAVAHAAKFGYRSVLQLLAEKGASVDAADENGVTPLMLASSAGHELVVKDLLKMGANVHLQSKSGDTARSLAARNGHTKLTSLLESHSSHSKRGGGLQSLLHELRLTKYASLFERHDIDFDSFCLLSEQDLRDIGVQIVGHRKLLCLAIEEQQQKLASGNDPQALRLLNSRLLTENQRLTQANQELELRAEREAGLRRGAERELGEGIKSIRSFTDVVLRTMAHSIALQEKLRQTLLGLKRVVLESNAGPQALPLLTHAEKLAAEVLRQSQLSLHQNTFRS